MQVKRDIGMAVVHPGMRRIHSEGSSQIAPDKLGGMTLMEYFITLEAFRVSLDNWSWII